MIHHPGRQDGGHTALRAAHSAQAALRANRMSYDEPVRSSSPYEQPLRGTVRWGTALASASNLYELLDEFVRVNPQRPQLDVDSRLACPRLGL